MGSSIGHIFKLSTFGESHGKSIGGIIEGCPPNIPLDLDQIQRELDRRRPGQSKLSTARSEKDKVQILSGVFEGKTLGSPIGFIIANEDTKPRDYSKFKDRFRPSHADYTTQTKYGIRDWRGGGRASARETACRIVGGSVASQVLGHFFEIEILAWVEQVGSVRAEIKSSDVSYELANSNAVRCPDAEKSLEMISLIQKVKSEKDTIGGVIHCVCRNVPAGFGQPVFDKLEADLAKAMMSIPASKGFSIGSGFSSAAMRGSEHNDPFFNDNGNIKTKSNHSGGVQGGITNGMNIEFKVAFKPVATIAREQRTVDELGHTKTIEAKGRHDPCVVPRATPIIEAMAAITLCDHFLRQLSVNPYFLSSGAVRTNLKPKKE